MASKAPRKSVPFILSNGARAVEANSRSSDEPLRRLICFPGAQTAFVGRESEIAALRAFLPDPQQRLITVLGPGGVGKTRIALTTAELGADAFPDGAAFVALAGLSDPRQIAGEMATALDVREQPDLPILQTVISALDRSQLLLVLDNLEHLMGPELQSIVSRILQACPGVTVLATSREPLHIGLEQRIVISPMQVPAPDERANALHNADSVKLFVARARAVAPEFAPGPDELRVVVEICRRLDGLPLAIELAAAWMRVLSPSALLAQLSESLPVLADGPLDQPARFRTMRDAIAWSYDRLPAAEAALLRRLSVFRGGFSLQAALHLEAGAKLGSTTATLHLVASLCDKNLLFRAGSIGEFQRFGMLETIREFAVERLAETDGLPSTQAVHAAYYRDFAERIEPILLGPRERFWFELLDAEASNFREAIAWGLRHDVENALRTLSALWGYWSWRAVGEGRLLFGSALAQPNPVSPNVRARALRSACALANLGGDHQGSAQFASEALSLARHIDDRWILGELYWNCGLSSVFAGDLQQAAQEMDAAIPLMDQPTSVSDRAIAAYALSHRGMVAHLAGDHEAGNCYLAQSLDGLRKAESPTMLVIVLGDAAAWHLQDNRIESARLLLQEALHQSRESSVGWAQIAPLCGLALIDAMEGRAVRASRRLGAITAMAARAGLASAPNFQGALDQAKSIVVSHLGQAAFMTEWETGRCNPAPVIEEAFATAGETSETPRQDAQAPLSRLSTREREVLGLIISGHTDRDIAKALFISERTVSKHVSTILQKLNAVSRADAAVKAVRLGLF